MTDVGRHSGDGHSCLLELQSLQVPSAGQTGRPEGEGHTDAATGVPDASSQKPSSLPVLFRLQLMG